MSDFPVTHTSVQTFLNLSEIECSAKCLRVDLCQAAIVVKTTEEQFQRCFILLYEEDSTNVYSLDLQDLDGISAIWFKNREGTPVCRFSALNCHCAVVINFTQINAKRFRTLEAFLFS